MNIFLTDLFESKKIVILLFEIIIRGMIMNPLDKITGTIVTGLAIAIVIAVVNSMAAQPFAMGTALRE